jgi:hypothetical protein
VEDPPTKTNQQTNQNKKNGIFKVLGKMATKILYLEKISFKSEGQIETDS